MPRERATPEELLRRINSEKGNDGRGHLKIFFGYAAGVGKTYSMLRAAHEAKAQGIDVVIGYIEPHARPETMALIDGLPSLPVKKLAQSGITLKEFDIDAALKRQPKIILVDELAHSNAEGCRHAKRYQDVQELLQAGIDVYTTVNVQHLESLNDMVASITGVTVRERIPDKIFDEADSVDLIDIEPEELKARLMAGKVYREEQAQKALGNFFEDKNLTALSEMAMRRCADRMSKIAERVRTLQSSDYYTDEHILVCLSPSPANSKIIRTAARMADAFKCKLTALFVETSEFASMSDEDKNRLRENMRLAQQLKAAIETVYGDDIAVQIAEFARLSGVSKVVMGRASARKGLLFAKPSLTDQLLVTAPSLDIYIIPDSHSSHKMPTALHKQPVKISFGDTLKSLAILAASSTIGIFFLHLGFTEANIITVYILGVLFTAVVTSHRVYSMAASIVSVLAFNFLFTAPRFTFSAYDEGYPVTFLIMFLSAFITGTLADTIKRHARQAAQTAYRTKLLLETNQLLQKCKTPRDIASAASGQLLKLLDKSIIFYLPENGALSKPMAFAKETVSADAYITENEKAIAEWVFKNNRRAGATTQTLGSSKCLYLAVRVNETVYGVVGIVLDGETIDSFVESIVFSILGECALALESNKALRERESAAVLAKNEQLRANLLRSISHDLRTPLTSISGNAGILLSNSEKMDEEKKRMLYEDIYDDSLWLINLVENLLSVTRIEDGTMQLKMRAELIDDVIVEALHHLSRTSGEHIIDVIHSEEILLAKMEAKLIVQVVMNLVDNAVKYTPKGSRIVISTKKSGKNIAVSVADNGSGIPDEDKPRIFDMFYTAGTTSADSRRSLGLGLALCKSIINAHGGDIMVSDNRPQGTLFTFTLPSEEVLLHE